jgi:hypothetical protein
MDIVKRIILFFVIAAEDKRLSTSHICVYLALCAAHGASNFQHPFPISRRKIMRACNIQGIATYHKCIRQLHLFGYIRYFPSYHPTQGSLVELTEFSSLLNY